MLRSRQHVLDRCDDRRASDDPRLAVNGLTQLVQGANAVPCPRRGGVGLEPPQLLARRPCSETIEDAADVQARVPDVDVPHRGEALHRLAVLARGRLYDRPAGRIVEAAIASGDGQARREPFHIPLERAWQGLVEVVDAEDEPPVGRGEHPEVGQMRVAAELNEQSGPGTVGEVRRHNVGRPAEERERRHKHASVSDRHELRQARLRLLLEQGDRIRPVAQRLPVAVCRSRQLPARGLASRCPFGGREVRHRGSRPCCHLRSGPSRRLLDVRHDTARLALTQAVLPGSWRLTSSSARWRRRYRLSPTGTSP